MSLLGLPLELREEIYAMSMTHDLKPTVDASLLRVNHQVHEEALAVMLREFTFILVTFIGGAGASAVRAIDNSMRLPKTSHGVSTFPHYVAELQLSNPDAPSTVQEDKDGDELKVTQFMICDGWTWSRVLCIIAGTTTAHEVSVRELKVRLNFNDIALSSQRGTIEASLFSGVKRYMWNFDDFEIFNAMDASAADELVELVSKDRWPTLQHYLADLDAWRKEGEEAFAKSSTMSTTAILVLHEAAMLADVCEETGHWDRWITSVGPLRLLNYRKEHSFKCFVTMLEVCMMLALAWSPSKGHEDNGYAVAAVNRAQVALACGRARGSPGVFRADDDAIAKVLYQQGVAYKLLNRLEKAEGVLSDAVKLGSEIRPAALEELERIRTMRKNGLDQELKKHGIMKADV